MKPFSPALVLGLVFLSGCAVGPNLTLKDIQPIRVIHLSHAEAFEAVRFFGIKEGFRIDNMEAESGRIVGHCTYQPTPSAATNKMIIMNVRISPVDAERSEVNVRFAFSSVNDALTRDEEGILVDHYQTFFSVLEEKAQ